MCKNWKYLALILVSVYLFNGLAAITYANAFEDVFASNNYRGSTANNNDPKVWDFSDAQDVGGYIDVISYSLGEKTIDFIMAFGIVFAALYMGFGMMGSMGGGFSMNDQVKTAQTAFAAFAGLGTAFYVNMNEIPFTNYIAPYALFLTVGILALIMGNMILKLRKEKSDMGTLLVGIGMSGLVVGFGMNSFLEEAGFGGVGVFIAVIGGLMLVLGVILSISGKYESKNKKDREVEKAAEEASADEGTPGTGEDADIKGAEKADYLVLKYIYAGQYEPALSEAKLERVRAEDLIKRIEKDIVLTDKIINKSDPKFNEHDIAKRKKNLLDEQVTLARQIIIKDLNLTPKNQNYLIGLLEIIIEYINKNVRRMGGHPDWIFKDKWIVARRNLAIVFANKLWQKWQQISNWETEIKKFTEEIKAETEKEVQLDAQEERDIRVIRTGVINIGVSLSKLAKANSSSEDAKVKGFFKHIRKHIGGDITYMIKELDDLENAKSYRKQLKYLKKISFVIENLHKEIESEYPSFSHSNTDVEKYLKQIDKLVTNIIWPAYTRLTVIFRREGMI